MPRLFPFQPFVLNFSTGESKALSLIHRMTKCIYPTYVAHVLDRRYSDDKISFTISFTRVSTRLTLYFKSIASASLTSAFMVSTNVETWCPRAESMLQILLSLTAYNCLILAHSWSMTRCMQSWIAVYGCWPVLHNMSIATCWSLPDRIIRLKLAFRTPLTVFQSE